MSRGIGAGGGGGGGEFVVVAGGGNINPGFSMSMSTLASDLSHEEAVARVKDLMQVNQDLQDALKKNTQAVKNQIQKLGEYENQQGKKDAVINHFRLQAKQVITELRQDIQERDQLINQLKNRGHAKSGGSDNQNTEDLRMAYQMELQQYMRRLDEFQNREQKHQHQIETLRQEKEALLADNQGLHGQMWQVVGGEDVREVIEEEQKRRPQDKVASSGSTIPTMVDEQRVTNSKLFTAAGGMDDENTETIYDDVLVPPQEENVGSADSKEKREWQLQLVALRGRVAELEAKLHEKEKQLREYSENGGVDSRQQGAMCEVKGQAEEAMQRERQRHYESEQQLTAKIQQMQQQMQNAGGDENMTLRNQATQLFTTLSEKEQQIHSMHTAMQEKEQQYGQVLQKLSMLEQDQQGSQADTDALIATLQKQLTHAQQSMKEHGQENIALKEQYDQLITDHHLLLQKIQQQGDPGDREETDRLTASLVAAEDVISKQKAELAKLKQDTSEIEVLKAQAEIYMADFHAERKARENMNTEKVRLQEELSQMRIRNQELLDEVQHYSESQIAEMQRRHAAQNQRPGAHLMPGGAAGYVNMPTQPRREDNGGGRSHMTREQIFSCPLCQANFPDLDSLQVHCTDCDGLPEGGN